MRTRVSMVKGLAAGMTLGLAATPAAAFEFSVGPIQGSVAQSISWGAQWSTQSADERYLYTGTTNPLVGPLGQGSNGGTNTSPNEDNGRLNYNTGLISNQIKGRTEIGLQFGGLGSDAMGSVTKVSYFYDFYYKDHKRRRTQPNNEQDNELGADIRLLENYVYWEGMIGEDVPLNLRLGDQVINWSESGLILGSNSYINPVDFNRVLSTTFNAEELYDPIGAIFASASITADLTLEAYYQYDWKPARIPPGGTFFGNTDYVGAGLKDSGEGYLCIDAVSTSDVPPFGAGCGFLTEDEDASQSGQWGVRASFYVPELNNTNFSLYYFRYHDRLPHVVVTSAGGIPGLFAPGLGGVQQAQVALGYREDIDVWGATFNTTVGDGYAVAGEVTLREDVPLQIHTTEVQCATAYIFAGGANRALNSRPAGPNTPTVSPTCNSSHLPTVAPGGRFDSGDPRNVVNAQMSVLKTWPQMFGGNDLLMLFEVGMSKVVGMPNSDELLYESDDVGEAPNTAAALTYHADSFGWGYRILFTNEYTRFSNIFRNVNMTVKPLFIFSHDVNGNTVKNLASYKEGTKQVVAGVTLDYQNQYSLSFRYNTWFGNKDTNMLADRDNITMTLSADF